MPVWWTEWGWFGEDHDDPDIPPRDSLLHRRNIVSERQQANYCVRSHLIGIAEGVERLFYFTMVEKSELAPWAIGLTRPPGRGIRPVVCAYNTMTWMLDGKAFRGEARLGPDILAMAFGGAGERLVAYWYGGSPERRGTLHVALPADAVRVVDGMDNAETLAADADGLVLPVDGGPRYLVSARLQCAELLSAFQESRVDMGR